MPGCGGVDEEHGYVAQMSQSPGILSFYNILVLILFPGNGYELDKCSIEMRTFFGNATLGNGRCYVKKQPGLYIIPVPLLPRNVCSYLFCFTESSDLLECLSVMNSNTMRSLFNMSILIYEMQI